MSDSNSQTYSSSKYRDIRSKAEILSSVTDDTMSDQHTDQYAHGSLATTAHGDEEEGRPTDFSSAVDPSRNIEYRQNYRPGDTVNMSDREKQKTRRDKKISLQTSINTLNGSDPDTDLNKLRATGVKELEKRLRSLQEQQPQAPVEVSSRQAVTEAGSGMAMEVSEEGVGASEMGQSLAAVEQVDWAGMQQGINEALNFVWTDGNNFSG